MRPAHTADSVVGTRPRRPSMANLANSQRDLGDSRWQEQERGEGHEVDAQRGEDLHRVRGRRCHCGQRGWQPAVGAGAGPPGGAAPPASLITGQATTGCGSPHWTTQCTMQFEPASIPWGGHSLPCRCAYCHSERHRACMPVCHPVVSVATTSKLLCLPRHRHAYQALVPHLPAVPLPWRS
jgi:hypothetical protein